MSIAPLAALLLVGLTAAPDPETLARGERVMRRFCLSCHGSPGGTVEDPLGPRLRPEVWSDEARAYAQIGEMWRLNRRMDQPFTGPDEDRRALAAWLSWRAARNTVPAWHAALPWAAAAIGLALAAAVLARGVRSTRLPPPS